VTVLVLNYLGSIIKENKYTFFLQQDNPCYRGWCATQGNGTTQKSPMVLDKVLLEQERFLGHDRPY